MNVKADRIESVIQVLNRNLLLIISGEPAAGLSNPERRSLKRVDTSVFSSDRFAYEMLEFFKSYRKLDGAGEGVVETWERQFMRGLELLLCECAVVKDEVERECFVSRVYAWFMEKLVERKGLDNAEGPGGPEPLKFDSIVPMRRRKFTVDGDLDSTQNIHPGIKVGDQLYVKHTFPKLSGAQGASKENNYGMLYHEPTTEAEIEMNELWLAKRQQEIFETKAQQQLNVALDRMSLQKSRIESEALRRTETASFLAAVFEQEHLRQPSPPQQPRSSQMRPLSAENSRFAPVLKRPISGKRQYKAAMDAGYDKLEELAHRFASDGESAGLGAEDGADGEGARGTDASKVISVKKGADGVEEEISINRTRRSVVEKQLKSFPPPMRFKHDAPEGFVAKRHKEKKLIMESYLQDYDSDDSDKGERGAGKEAKSVTAVTTERAASAPAVAPSGKKPGAGGAGGALAMRDPVRDRPVSAQRFKELSVNDSETKVMYRYSNFRRMPINAEQEMWLQSREDARIKEAMDALKAKGDAKPKSGKGKGGGKEGGAKGGAKEKGGGKEKKGKGAKEAAGKKGSATGPAAPGTVPVAKKYKSASEFMDVHFPQFDDDENEDCIGPLRAEQLEECNRAAKLLSVYNVPSAVIRRALVIPQDRPEAICLENAKDSVEGLMVNPLPREFWRVATVKAATKKGKKGGKKKKK